MGILEFKQQYHAIRWSVRSFDLEALDRFKDGGYQAFLTGVKVKSGFMDICCRLKTRYIFN